MLTRSTSSNLNVVVKNPQDTFLATKPGQAKKSAKLTSKPDACGLESDEDDSLECEVAMSSPMKGGEYRKSVEVCLSLFRMVFMDFTQALGIGQDQRCHLKATACSGSTSRWRYRGRCVDSSCHTNIYQSCPFW